MSRKIWVSSLIIVGTLLPRSIAAQITPQVIGGSCTSRSHIAEGIIGEDLTKRQKPFSCSMVTYTVFNNRHVIVQFPSSTSKQILGFGGELQSDGLQMTVSHAYFQGPGQETPVDVGICKFFLQGKKLTGTFCGAKIDQNGRRTVIVVDFSSN